jgi:2-polyprenyl-6-methoxyphenol hydroxylase-like FAD-dependent oxidoreductase
MSNARLISCSARWRTCSGYLIAADGAMSPVREALGITSWTLEPTHHYLNLSSARTWPIWSLAARSASATSPTTPSAA